MQTLKDTTCKAATRRRLGRLSPDSTRHWGKMTTTQMVCHLGDSYQMATGERPGKDRSSWWTVLA